MLAREAYDAIEAGAEDVATDERTRQVKRALSAGVYLEDGPSCATRRATGVMRPGAQADTSMMPGICTSGFTSAS
ncbi:hypothetical protein [Burkholderia ubonensis]|uniref:hypothetical protein n=1 Tax=Burkholderia ubonensis TaxID=101571 RepID=UPI000BD743BE|nr:hypothetical protein CJO71_24735 [Burkholderia ubonensis]PAJ86622.1 hypothetical protein CJO70_16065 [Burkholderia ubonensis]PAJ95077.1 hypothetical protein CJO69_07480 [Burkholderia ubonensis]PAJ99874.1 hypothetical protein CJO68_17055 [Burkholderia ubonensis]PAK06997.1 hypothetical protein CJO67_16190 [Burkholderia ubonensis]